MHPPISRIFGIDRLHTNVRTMCSDHICLLSHECVCAIKTDQRESCCSAARERTYVIADVCNFGCMELWMRPWPSQTCVDWAQIRSNANRPNSDEYGNFYRPWHTQCAMVKWSTKHKPRPIIMIPFYFAMLYNYSSGQSHARIESGTDYFPDLEF